MNLGQALELSRIHTSRRLPEVYRNTRAAPTPWAKSTAVRELDALAADVVV
ncbi:hypothetical protein [Nocardia sp. NPDC004750]